MIGSQTLDRVYEQVCLLQIKGQQMQTAWEIMALNTAEVTELSSASQDQTPSPGSAAPAAELGSLKFITASISAHYTVSCWNLTCWVILITDKTAPPVGGEERKNDKLEKMDSLQTICEQIFLISNSLFTLRMLRVLW